MFRTKLGTLRNYVKKFNYLCFAVCLKNIISCVRQLFKILSDISIKQNNSFIKRILKPETIANRKRLTSTISKTCSFMK